MNKETNETYLRGFLPRAVFMKMKCLHWHRYNDTGALSMALFIFASDALRTALRKADGVSAWGERDIKAIREAA